MENFAVTTLITRKSVISKFKTDKEKYTVFTTELTKDAECNSRKYQSIIKFTKYKKILWSSDAHNITDALSNHVALIKMAIKHSILSWNLHLFEACKPKQAIENLHQQKVHSKEHTFISAFTSKLFKAERINASKSGIEINSKILAAFVAALTIGLLSFGLDFNE